MSVFEVGKKGFYKNETNPYSMGSFSHKEWERGYNAAYFEHLEKVKQRERREVEARS